MQPKTFNQKGQLETLKLNLKHCILLDLKHSKTLSLKTIHRIAQSLNHKESYAERLMRYMVSNPLKIQQHIKPYKQIKTLYATTKGNNETVVAYKLIK